MRDQQPASKRSWRVARFPLASLAAATAMVAAASVGSAAGAWTVVSSPSPSGGGQFNGVSCRSSTFCVGVGQGMRNNGTSYQHTLAETWNGSAWLIIPSPDRGTYGSWLNSVSCVSSSSCMAVGEYVGHTLAETWNGTAWSVVATPNKTTEDNYLNGVSCASSTSCIAVGAYGYPPNGTQLALVESWNGSTWSIIPAPARSNASRLNAVSCISSSDCVAVGAYQSATRNRYQTLIESWNGSVWSVIASPNQGTETSYLSGVTCATSTSCMAVGYYQNKTTQLYETLVEDWNGSGWTIVSSPSPKSSTNDNFLTAVSCVSSVSCVAVGNDARTTTLIESWNGSNWSVTTSPALSGGAVLSGVSCSTSCVAVGAVAVSAPAETLAETGPA